MGSTYIVCCVLAIALNQHVVVEGAVCANDNTRASCSWEAVVSTQTACNALAGGCCNWCTAPTPMPITRRCQTDNFACLVVSPTIISTGTTLALCTDAGGIYCSGDTSQKCICDEPLLKLCHKPAAVTACPNANADQAACDEDTDCFWCGEGLPTTRLNKCFAKPVGADSCITGSCCDKLKCATTVTAPTCTLGFKPCIWDDVTIPSLTEQRCHEFNKHCAWCPTGQDTIKKRCQTVDRSCLVAEQWVITAETETLCTNAGGIYCHGDCAATCIYPEPADKICFKPGGITGTGCADTAATTKPLCIAAGCVWCDGTGVIVRRDKCWEMPSGAECVGTTGQPNCCMEHRCMDGNTFVDATCTDMGCVVCTGPKLCVYK